MEEGDEGKRARQVEVLACPPCPILSRTWNTGTEHGIAAYFHPHSNIPTHRALFFFFFSPKRVETFGGFLIKYELG
jgi:hypothetical protein